jgi:hypothetical protein
LTSPAASTRGVKTGLPDLIDQAVREGWTSAQPAAAEVCAAHAGRDVAARSFRPR